MSALFFGMRSLCPSESLTEGIVGLECLPGVSSYQSAPPHNRGAIQRTKAYLRRSR
jgi:hypothetical protein